MTRSLALLGALIAVAGFAAVWLVAGASGEGAARGDARGGGGSAQAPLPRARPKLVQPVAGAAAAVADDEQPATGVADEEPTRKPSGPASVTARPDETAPTAVDGSVKRATALPNGVALPPLEAPAPVLKIIEAGNAIARAPYKWGGGHGRWVDKGYDCSGSVSFALYFAGLLDGPHDSTGLMRYGEPGRGKWVTLYANHGHVFMEVAGIRFDTSGARRTGSRWQNDLRSGAGYVARHPPGL